MATTAHPYGHTNGRPAQPRLHAVLDRLEHAEQLDPAASKVAKQVRDAVPAGPVKDALSGRWLGHALHPLLTDVPIGTWTSAALLDLLGGRAARPAAQRLVGLGILAAVPTAATGASDWADTTVADEKVRRVGAVHAVANTLALTLYTASWGARRRGRHGLGVAYGLAGAAALAVGGHLGGHLSYAQGVGVDQTTFEERPRDWTDVGTLDELGDGRPHCVAVAGVSVLVVRDGDALKALDARCCHRGGPLHEGEIADGCVTCPWHGSRFSLDDGSVVRGPAAYAQPAYDVRVDGDRVRVRARED